MSTLNRNSPQVFVCRHHRRRIRRPAVLSKLRKGSFRQNRGQNRGQNRSQNRGRSRNRSQFQNISISFKSLNNHISLASTLFGSVKNIAKELNPQATNIRKFLVFSILYRTRLRRIQSVAVSFSMDALLHFLNKSY